MYSQLSISHNRNASYLKSSKLMVILRGAPGCGKSTAAELLMSVYGPAATAICSADDFFVQPDGRYVWSAALIGRAHEQCRACALDACRRAVPLVIIDCTNILLRHFSYYIQIAQRFHYFVFLFTPPAHRLPALQLLRRCRHGVPLSTIQEKQTMFQKVDPLYFGWFLNEKDSAKLQELGEKVRGAVEQAASFFKAATYNSGEVESNSALLHCTAKYCGGRPSTNATNYADRNDVQQAIGSVSNVEVSGFLFTTRSACARVRLSTAQKRLFDNTVSPADFVPVAQFYADLMPTTVASLPTAVHWTSDTLSTPSNCSLLGDAHPLCGLAANCHVTLGVAASCRPVHASADVAQLLQLEAARAAATSTLPVQTLSLSAPPARVVFFRRDFVAVYLQQPLTYPAVFLGHYRATGAIQ